MISFVICGVEHSGTTLISDLFRQIPHVDSGFETGVLLSASPREFIHEMPFAANILGGWNMTQEELAFCCDTGDFAEFYARLARIGRDVATATTIFDKTPRYLAHLPDCMAKMDVPFVVTAKDPRSIVFSDFARSQAPDFDAWFETYADAKLGYMRHLYGMYQGAAASSPKAHRIRLETLCLRPRETCEALFAHCGQRFSLRYLLFEKLRYHHTRATTISPRIPFEYMQSLSSDQIGRIVRHFAELDAWFYD